MKSTTDIIQDLIEEVKEKKKLIDVHPIKGPITEKSVEGRK